jgi:hypothetical protein
MNPLALLGLGGAASWALRQRFHNRAQRDLRALASVNPRGARDDARLPERLRALIGRALPGSGLSPVCVRLEQTGDFRHEPRGAWIPFTATQHIGVGLVGYQWRAKLAALGVFRTDAIDSLVHGEGRLEASLLGLWPLPAARGDAVHRAQVFRYLAELPWAPHAHFANPALAWSDEGADLRVYLDGKEGGPSVTFGLDGHGDIVRASALRPRIKEGAVKDTPWTVSFADYDTLEGMRIPRMMEASWEGDSPLLYLRARIERVHLL